MSRAARTLRFYVSFGAVTAAVTPTSLMTVLLTGNGDLGQRLHARPWARAILRLSGLRARASGLERVDPGVAYVVMANHAVPLALVGLPATLPLPWRITMRAELRRIPIFSFMSRIGGQLFLDLSSPEAARRSLDAARPVLARGVSVIVFPEGRRSAGGPLHPLKRGGFHLALETGAPILPVRIELGPSEVALAYAPPIDVRGREIGSLVTEVADAIRPGAAGVPPRPRPGSASR